MDRSSEVEEGEQIAEFTLTDEDMMVILKALDLYGYALLLSNNVEEIMKARAIIMKIITVVPPTGLNS